MSILVDSVNLSRFVNNIFKSIGFHDQDAALIAETLVEADLRGIDSHGVMRIPAYLKWIKDGEIDIHSTPKIIRETPSSALIDGGHGMGQVFAYHGMKLAIEKAKETGIGVVGINHNNHFGAAAYYTKMAAKENLIGLSCTSTRAIMPPPGGIDNVVGNNPLSIAIPSNRYKPIILDMATSVAAVGKVMMASKRGEPIPEGWALDANGEMTTDPDKALAAMKYLSVGGPKGFGLAVAIEVLTGVLLESGFSVYRSPEYPRESGHFMLAINIESFTSINHFKENVDLFIDAIKNSKPSASGSEVFYPGEPEYLREEARSAKGIPLTTQVYTELTDVAKELKVDMFEVK